MNWRSALSDVCCVLARAPSFPPPSIIYNSSWLFLGVFGKAFAPFFSFVLLFVFFRLKQNCNCGREPLIYSVRRSPWNNQIWLFYETVKLALFLSEYLFVCLFVCCRYCFLLVVVFTRLFVRLFELCLDAAPHEVIFLYETVDLTHFSFVRLLVCSFVLFCSYCFGFVCMQHPTKRVDLTRLRESFTRSVVRRMMTDVPWGVLLSGRPSFHAKPNPNQPKPDQN